MFTIYSVLISPRWDLVLNVFFATEQDAKKAFKKLNKDKTTKFHATKHTVSNAADLARLMNEYSGAYEEIELDGK